MKKEDLKKAIMEKKQVPPEILDIKEKLGPLKEKAEKKAKQTKEY